MSNQERAHEMLGQVLPKLGQWEPATLFGLLGTKLHQMHGYTGPMQSIVDLLALSDELADAACTLLPQLVADLPCLDDLTGFDDPLRM